MGRACKASGTSAPVQRIQGSRFRPQERRQDRHHASAPSSVWLPGRLVYGGEGFFLPLCQLIVVMETVNQPLVGILLARIVRHLNWSNRLLKGNKKECQMLEVHMSCQDQLAQIFPCVEVAADYGHAGSAGKDQDGASSSCYYGR